MSTAPAHHWRFFRLGGFDQVRLETADDLRHLSDLDQKLWAALSCPVHGLEFDPRTLSMLDTDGDGRVRAKEILQAVSWVSSVLRDMNPLLTGQSSLPLAAIDDSHPDGQALIASAKRILTYLEKSDATAIDIDDLADTKSLFINSTFNGDGVITPMCTDNPEVRRLIEDVITCAGSVMDRSGEPGISSEQVQIFVEAARRYVEWQDAAMVDAAILPMGESTGAAAETLRSIAPKIDDYFTRCSLAAFDPRAQEPLNPTLATYEALNSRNLSTATELADFPLARIVAARPLPLKTGLNPVWSLSAAQLNDLVVRPLFGDVEDLHAEQWQQIQNLFTPYYAWHAAKPGDLVEPLGVNRLRAILTGTELDEVSILLAEDTRLASQVDSFENVVRLVHYTRDLMHLLNNFVAFRDFYSQERKAVFQAGSLYLDGRACDLCIRVDNLDAHAALAGLSRTYLAYCQCRRRGSEERITIAAAFTGGDSDNLMVGRNGIFYDRQGNDWDATIVKIVEHPISVGQAFWAPYKRIARMIGEQIEKFATAKDQAVDAGAGAKLADFSAKPDSPNKTPFDVGKFAGIFAAIGLALGAIGTALASIVGGFLSLPLWQMPLTVGGVVLMISGPSMLIAYLKLRQRNLGPILDAGGWAVNSRASINIPFGATLTKMAELPAGAQRSLRDPFAEKNTPWKRWAVLLVVFVALGMAWDKGYIQKLATALKPVILNFQANTISESPSIPTAEQPNPATANTTATNATQ